MAEQTEFVDANSCVRLHFGLTVSRTFTVFAKCPIVIDIQSQGPAMPIRRLLFAFISLAIVLAYTSYGAEPPKQTKKNSANACRPDQKPVYLTVSSAAEIKH